MLFLADNENSEINKDYVYTGEHSFSMDDKSKVIQYRAIETISCSFILFYFVIFDPFPPFFLGPQVGPERGPEGGSRKGGPRLSTAFQNQCYQALKDISNFNQYFRHYH